MQWAGLAPTDHILRAGKKMGNEHWIDHQKMSTTVSKFSLLMLWQFLLKLSLVTFLCAILHTCVHRIFSSCTSKWPLELSSVTRLRPSGELLQLDTHALHFAPQKPKNLVYPPELTWIQGGRQRRTWTGGCVSCDSRTFWYRFWMSQPSLWLSKKPVLSKHHWAGKKTLSSQYREIFSQS